MNEYNKIINKRREEMRRIRAQQDAAEAVANEVRDRIGESAWRQLIDVDQLAEKKRGHVLEFYRDSSGAAQYRFRPATEAEQSEWASDWAEDNL